MLQAVGWNSWKRTIVATWNELMLGIWNGGGCGWCNTLEELQVEEKSAPDVSLHFFMTSGIIYCLNFTEVSFVIFNSMLVGVACFGVACHWWWRLGLRVFPAHARRATFLLAFFIFSFFFSSSFFCQWPNLFLVLSPSLLNLPPDSTVNVAPKKVQDFAFLASFPLVFRFFHASNCHMRKMFPSSDKCAKWQSAAVFSSHKKKRNTSQTKSTRQICGEFLGVWSMPQAPQLCKTFHPGFHFRHLNLSLGWDPWPS